MHNGVTHIYRSIATQLWAEHVRGVENEVADSSRDRLDLVFCLCPQMEWRPEPVDEEVLQVVVRQRNIRIG